MPAPACLTTAAPLSRAAEPLGFSASTTTCQAAWWGKKGRTREIGGTRPTRRGCQTTYALDEAVGRGDPVDDMHD